MTLRSRYPDADILSQRGHWDAATRQVVLDRVHNTPGFVFFDAHARATLEALCARVIPQAHRSPDRVVPIVPWIDARCAGDHGEGTRLEDLPSHNDAWRVGLLGLDQTAQAVFGEAASFSAAFPNGLANSSGLVGKFLMAQAGPVVWGRFDEPIRQYKAPPACALTEEFYETDPGNDFVRGYALQSVAPLPIAMAHLLIEEDGAYGERLLERMQDYNHYAALGVLGEILPDERNCVTLHPTQMDRYGLPAPYAQFSLFDNDLRMMHAGIRRARAVLEAAGATETHAVTRFAHLVGTCRIGFSRRDSVVDRWCRSWDVPNLLVCDGSVLPTQGSANLALTISALAARTADWLRRAAPAGELRSRFR